MCLYSRRRQVADGWLQIELALHERHLQQIFSGEDNIYTKKSEHQKSYVPSPYDYRQNDRQPYLVANEHPLANHKLNQSVATQTSDTSSRNDGTNDDVNAAVSNLIATLGHVEFRLGVQNVNSEQLDSAVGNFKSATVHRHPAATFNLGVCYELGLGVEKNLRRAMECYRTAASLGHKTAMFNLGVFYVHGYGGLEKNKKAAKACIKAAGEMGLSSAQKMLKAKREPSDKYENPLKPNKSVRIEDCRLLL